MNPLQEEKRIQELESYNINKDYPKKQLQSVIKLAAKICKVPVSLIDIIDKLNQRTIVAHGDWEEKVIPRGQSICDVVVKKGDLLIADDIRKHKILSDRLTETDKEKIRFYAGAPLKSSAGYTLGALCVIDSRPRKLTEFQKESLQILADEVMARLDLHKQKNLLQEKNKKLEKYSIFLENSADILCIIDPETQKITDINEDCDKELGFSKEEMINKQFSDFLELEDLSVNDIQNWFAMNNQLNGRYSIPIRFKNNLNEEKWFRCNFTEQKGKWYLTARNITDQKVAENQIKVLQQKFEKVAKATSDLIYEFNCETGEIHWGEGFKKMMGYPETEKTVNLTWWYDKVHPNDIMDVKNEFTEVINGDTVYWKKTYRFKTYDGSFKYLLNYSHIDRDEKSEPKKIIGALADITNLKEAELKQKNLLSRLNHAHHMADLGYWEIDLDDGKVFWSDEMYHILNTERSTEPSLDFILKRMEPEEAKKLNHLIHELSLGKGIEEVEHKINLGESEQKYLTHRGELIDEGVETKKIILTTQDITERKQKELKISESLREKETLLAEIHHRVKNNLAIISGLLELNLYQINDKKMEYFIRSNQLRIKSMANIHENLYKSETLTDVSFKEYINELISAIQASYFTENFEPKFITNIEDVHLNINHAIPCGLILNELITNSIKHAFPDQENGMIKISFSSVQDHINLSVEDNGIGVPEDFDFQASQSLGMTLIKILSKQINADLNIGNTENGFGCTIRFARKKIKGSGSNFT
jgi:PAS domain S-box-containing protein